MKQKVIFIDIDETLFCQGKGPFPADVEQIIEARKAGHKTLINTGRALANLPAALKDAPYFDGYVLGAGAHVILNGKTLCHSWVDQAVLQKICAFYLGTQKWCAFEGETGVFGTRPCPLPVLPPVLTPVKAPDDFSTVYRGEYITKISVQGCASDAERALLQAHFQLNAFDGYFEGIIKGASKARGMRLALDALGVPPENSVAIGDSMNDLDMLAAAGTGIAMANACDEVKRAARYITDDCAHAGVGKAIARWVLGTR